MIVTDPRGAAARCAAHRRCRRGLGRLRERADPRAVEPLLQQTLRARGWIDSVTGVTPERRLAFVGSASRRGLFEPGEPIAVARAPGRLDVMGGIADYSGSLVLERPIAEATWAAVQRVERPVLEVVSLGRPPLHHPARHAGADGAPIGYDEARRLFARRRQRWAAYVVGVVLVLARERGLPLTSGLAYRGRVGGARRKRSQFVGRGRNGQ